MKLSKDVTEADVD